MPVCSARLGCPPACLSTDQGPGANSLNPEDHRKLLQCRHDFTALCRSAGGGSRTGSISLDEGNACTTWLCPMGIVRASW